MRTPGRIRREQAIAVERRARLRGMTPVYAQVGGRGAAAIASGQAFPARLTDLGPMGQTLGDERYGFVELEALDVDDDGKICWRDRPGGREGVCTNLAEAGAGRHWHGPVGGTPSDDADAEACSVELVSGSGAEAGTSYNGFHGVFKGPSRDPAPVRLAMIHPRLTRTGRRIYLVQTPPAPITPGYYFDETCLSAGCPDGEHWKVWLTGVAVEDDSAGDEMPECGT